MGNAAVLMILLVVASEAPSPALPADSRLDAEREHLGALVEKAAQRGLPVDLLISKMQEGLAKNVQLHQIVAAADRFAESLQRAHAFVAERRPRTPPDRELVRALTEAQMAGCHLETTDALVRGASSPALAARAVDVLMELTQQGYLADKASHIVSDVVAYDPEGLDGLPAALRDLRREQGLSRSEAIQELALSLGTVGGLQADLQRALSRRGTGGVSRARFFSGDDLRELPRNFIRPTRSRRR